MDFKNMQKFGDRKIVDKAKPEHYERVAAPPCHLGSAQK